MSAITLAKVVTASEYSKIASIDSLPVNLSNTGWPANGLGLVVVSTYPGIVSVGNLNFANRSSAGLQVS